MRKTRNKAELAAAKRAFTNGMPASPTGFEDTGETREKVIAGKTVTMRLYRNPEGIEVWSTSEPTDERPEPQGASGHIR